MRQKSHVRFGKRDEGNNAGKPANCALIPTSRLPDPSPEDLGLTRDMVSAGDLLGVSLFDHIIIGRGTFVSLKERGLVPPV